MTVDRYTRQRRLEEIGDDGQRRLEAHRCRVPGDGAGAIAARYLEAAGVVVEVADGAPGDPTRPCPHDGHFRFAATRRLGAGSWRALDEIRRALQGGA